MQHQISGNVNTKKDAVKALLQNEKLSKMLRTAYDAPIGSTHRKQAQRIISIMKKLGVVDGSGGPSYIPPQMTYNNPAIKDYSKFIIFPAAPKPTARNTTNTQDGQGGPGSGNIFRDYPAPQVPYYEPKSRLGALLSSPLNLAAGAVNLGSQATKGIGIGLTAAAQGLGTATGNVADYMLGDPTQTYSQIAARNAAMNAPAARAGYVLPTPGQGGAYKPSDVAAFAAKPLTSAPLTVPSQTPVSGVMSDSPDASGQVQTPGGTQGDTKAPGVPSGTGSSTETPSGPPGKPDTSYTGIQKGAADAVQQNQGAGLFAYQNLMRSMSGNKDKTDEELPYGAALLGQYDQMDAALKQKYNLDSILNQKNALIERGVTLETDLADYIAGRDEFLNQTDQMLNSAKDRMLSMDMSDPVTAQQSRTYVNYLYTLRGRQNRRYVEYLNRAVGEYNTKLTAVSNTAEQALNLYEKELTAKTNLTSSEYQMYFNALSGLYTEIADAPKRQKELDKLQAEINQMNAKTAVDAAKSNSWDWLPNMKDYESLIKDKDGNVILGNIDSIGQAAVSSGRPYGEGLKVAETAIYSDLAQKAANDPQEGIKAANKYMNMAMDFKNSATDNYDKAYADSMIENIGKSLGSAVHGYAGNPQNLENLKTAAKALTKGSAWLSYKPVSRDEFIKSFKDQVDEALLDDMYSMFDSATRAGASPKNIFSTDDKEFINQLSDRIAFMRSTIAGGASGI